MPVQISYIILIVSKEVIFLAQNLTILIQIQDICDRRDALPPFWDAGLVSQIPLTKPLKSFRKSENYLENSLLPHNKKRGMQS